jgi:UDP-3-O-[3-hydroxymyristoyl] glucosamine N-acyltransferase
MNGVRFVDALGSPGRFRERAANLARSGIPPEHFLTLIHPQASVSSRALVGTGSLLFSHVVVGAGAHIGAHVTVLPLSVIHHDACIGDWSIIASHVGISGRAKVGVSCYIGTGAQIIQDGAIGDGAMVGMGAIVRHPVSAESTVVGNPAVLLTREGIRYEP